MPIIPKILHYVWLGSVPMHPLMDEWREKWKYLHPDWIVNMWRQIDGCPPHLLRNDDGQVVECRVPDYLAQCPTLAKRSDVWRYEILEQLGGVYLDADVEPVKNIDPLLFDNQAFAGLCETLYDWDEHHQNGKTKIEVGCAILGAVPHHPWTRELVRKTPTQDPKAKLSLASPFLTEVTGRHPEVVLFNPSAFYPIPWDRCALSRRSRIETIPDAAYAVHRWSSTWFPNGLRPIEDAQP